MWSAPSRDALVGGVGAFAVLSTWALLAEESVMTSDVLALGVLPCTVAVAVAGVVLMVTALTVRERRNQLATWLGCGLLLMTGLGGLVGELWRATAAPEGGWLAAVPLAALVVHVGLDRATGSRQHAPALLLLPAAVLVLFSPVVRDLPGIPDWEVQLLVCAGALASVGLRCARHPALPDRYRAAVAWGIGALAADTVLAVLGLAGPWVPVRAGVMVGGSVALVSVAWHWACDAGREAVEQVDSLVLDLECQHEQVLRTRTLLHDARATLAGIRAAREALTQGTASASQRPALEQALETEILRLVRQLEGRAPDDRSSSVDEALSPLVLTWRLRGVDLRYEPSTLRVAADADTVAEIVRNLVDNSSTHAPGATVRLVTDVVDDHVLLSVMDEGPGVPAEVRASLLVPGTRGPDSPGEGLGLASAARLAAQAGGDLRLLETGEGSWFMLRLPAARHER